MYPLRHRRLREALKAASKHRKEIVSEIHRAIEVRLEESHFQPLLKGVKNMFGASTKNAR